MLNRLSTPACVSTDCSKVIPLLQFFFVYMSIDPDKKGYPDNIFLISAQ